MIRIAEHAVARFVEYFRSEMPYAEAEQEFRRLVAAAARTRRNTLPGNARIYIGHTERGERVCIAVRGGLAITVIDPRVAAGMYLRAPRARARPAEAPDAGLVASLLADRSGERREKAASIVAAWKAGQPVASKTVRRAAALLGLGEQQLARVRVDGGRFAGVCIEVHEGDGVEDLIVRFREAIRARLGRREVG